MTAIVIVLIFLGILLLVPFGAAVIYKEDVFVLKIRIGWIRFKIVPSKEEKSSKKPAHKVKKEKRKEPITNLKNPLKKKKKRDLSFWLKIVKSGLKSLKILLRGIVVEKLDLDMLVADADKSKTALNYTRICSLVGLLQGLIDRFKFVKDYNIYIEPDFYGEKMKIEVETEVTMLLYSLFGMVFSFAFAFLKMIIKNKTHQSALRRGL